MRALDGSACGLSLAAPMALARAEFRCPNLCATPWSDGMPASAQGTTKWPASCSCSKRASARNGSPATASSQQNQPRSRPPPSHHLVTPLFSNDPHVSPAPATTTTTHHSADSPTLDPTRPQPPTTNQTRVDYGIR